MLVDGRHRAPIEGSAVQGLGPSTRLPTIPTDSERLDPTASMDTVEIATERGRYLFMFPRLRGRSREEDIGKLISWLESGST